MKRSIVGRDVPGAVVRNTTLAGLSGLRIMVFVSRLFSVLTDDSLSPFCVLFWVSLKLKYIHLVDHVLVFVRMV